MAELDYIARMIGKAQEIESRRPQTAHAFYETAERRLDEILISSWGVFRDALENCPCHPLSRIFLPYYSSIMAGYERLNLVRDTQASSL